MKRIKSLKAEQNNYTNHNQNNNLISILELNQLSKLYEQRISNIIQRLQGKTVVLDFDGVLTEFKYTEKSLLPCKEIELYEYSKNNNLYENVYISKSMQYILSQIKSENIWILTSSRETLINNKEHIIRTYFPMIKLDQVIHTENAKAKIIKLKEIYEITQKDIIFIEDMAPTLTDSEETHDFVRGIHITSLLP